MTALACLRILNDSERVVAGVETPTLAARRTVAGWLVARWKRPNRFGEVAPGVFVLTEQDVEHLGAAPLVALTRELRHCPVSLALLDGDQADVTRFAALHSADLRAVLAGLMVVEGTGGEISVITPDGVVPVHVAPDHKPLRLVMEDGALVDGLTMAVAAA